MQKQGRGFEVRTLKEMCRAAGASLGALRLPKKDSNLTERHGSLMLSAMLDVLVLCKIVILAEHVGLRPLVASQLG